MRDSANTLSWMRCLGIAKLLVTVSLFVAGNAPWLTQGQNNNKVTIVSAASYGNTVAPDSIATAFGAQLAVQTQLAGSQPLPTNLVGTTVKVNGRAAGLFFCFSLSDQLPDSR